MPTVKSDVRDSLFIGGRWVPSTGSGSIDVIDSTTEEVIGTVPEGTVEDIDQAVAAAADAFPGWSTTPVAERTALLTKVGGRLGERMEDLAALITHEVGMPLVLSQLVQVGLPMNSFNAMAQVAADFTWEQTIGNSLVVREPIGVVGAITPWNYPLHQIAAKVAPALAAGCTVVLKPSEVAPLNAFVLAEIFEQVGLPPGVFNLVTGFGPVVGEAIAAHPDVDMVSFTGSTRAGRRVSEVASATVKRVALELGGKSANVILDDADLSQAVPDGVRKCYINSGQTCSALTRMLVPRDRLAEVEELATVAAESFTPGDPFDAETRLGPLVSAVQRDRVRNYIDKGIGEGARLADRRDRGARRPRAPDSSSGRPCSPSVTPDMTIARDEIFGPVLAIIPYDSEDEAVEIANDTEYGLAGGVWSGDPERAKAGGPPAADRPGRGQRRGVQSRWPRSGATSSRATGASSAPSGWRSSSRSSPSSCRRTGIERRPLAGRLPRSEAELVLDEAEMDLGRVDVGLLADEDVLGARVHVPEGPFEPAPFADGRGPGGQVGPLDDLPARLGGEGGRHPEVGPQGRGERLAVGDRLLDVGEGGHHQQAGGLPQGPVVGEVPSGRRPGWRWRRRRPSSPWWRPAR